MRHEERGRDVRARNLSVAEDQNASFAKRWTTRGGVSARTGERNRFGSPTDSLRDPLLTCLPGLSWAVGMR